MIPHREHRTKFCILTTQRSGSTWLTELLNSDCRIRTFGEIFLWRSKKNKLTTIVSQEYQNHYSSFHSKEISCPAFYDYSKSNFGMRPWMIFKYLDQLDRYRGDHLAIGFKLMYNQLILRPEILIKFALDGYKVIHLVRENYLDILISKASMKQHGYVHLKSDIDVLPIFLETSSLLLKLSAREFAVSSVQSLLKVLPNSVLEINYKSLCDDRNNVLYGITDFLKIPRLEIEYTSDLKKINSGNYCQKITNYEQVKETLEGTRFQSLLN